MVKIMMDNKEFERLERERLDKCIIHTLEKLDYLKELTARAEAELDSLLEELENLCL